MMNRYDIWVSAYSTLENRVNVHGEWYKYEDVQEFKSELLNEIDRLKDIILFAKLELNKGVNDEDNDNIL